MSIQNALKIIEVLNHSLVFPCNLIEYQLLNPDSFEYYYHEIGNWTNRSAFISKLPEQLVLYGENGDMSAPCITVVDGFSNNHFFSNYKIEIQYPVYSFPFIIRIDFKTKAICNRKRTISEVYFEILHQLDLHGIHVNNSFAEICFRKKEVYSLDGIQIGEFVAIREKKKLKHFSKHSRFYCLNHLRDIFFANSIVIDCLKYDTIEKIERIVGKNNYLFIGDSIAFSLPRKNKNISYLYRFQNKKTIKQLKSIL